MAFRVEIQPRALDDVDAIAQYLRAVSSPAVAQRWFTSIFDSLASLRLLPSRCPIAPESSELGHEVRLLLHGKRNKRYKIYFAIEQVTPSTGTIHVLHVRHWARHPVTRDELGEVIPD